MDQSQMFDLLPNGRKNATFRVSFDFYTPRAHFILLPKSSKNIEPEFSRMTPEQVYELIEAAKTMLSTSGVERGILSIHRGSWISAKDRFLAHLCVDIEMFLNVFRKRKKEIPNWPSTQYVTKQWKASKDAASYEKNVSGYPYRSYLDEEVAEIMRIRRSVPDDTRGNATAKCSGLNVVYHSSHPKIGFVGSKVQTTEHLQQVLFIMESYAKDHDLTKSQSQDDNSGCHLCLYLGSETQECFFPVVEEPSSACDVVGYIVTTGARFYNLCPPKYRKPWFEAFKLSKFTCET